MLLCDVKKLLSIDISDNKLTSLYPVRLAANLVYLNASNNQIRSAAELSANAKLEHVDLRRNLITSLGDILSYLTTLGHANVPLKGFR